jgi:hypothetical protein
MAKAVDKTVTFQGGDARKLQHRRALRAKIDRCRLDADAPVPEIVEVVQDAYHLAQRWRYQSFLLSEDPAAGHSSNNGQAAAPG